MRPRGPPGTSAPTNAAQPWCAGPHSRDARGRMHGRGGRPRPPAPRTHKDDAGGRCVHAGRRGRRPLPTPHSRGVQDHTHHVARRAVYMVGADVPGRPPPAQGRRRRTMRPRGPPRTSAPTNAALPWCAGPHASCGTQGRMYGRGGRPRPPAPRTHKDDAGGRCVHAGRRGRRPLPTPHSRGVQGRAHIMWRAGRRCARHTYRCGISSPV